MNKLEHTPIPGDHLAQRGVSPFPRRVYSPSEQTFRTMCWGKGGCQVYLQLPLIFKRKSSFLCSQGFVILWFMVKKKKNAYLVLVSGTELLKPLKIPVLTAVKITFVMDMRWLDTSRMGAGFQETSLVTGRLELSVSSPEFPERGEGLEVELISNGQ